MIIPSLPFLGFAAVAAIVFNLSRAARWRQAILLVVNIAFLASLSHDPVAFLPLLGFLALGYLAYRITEGGSAARLFPVLIVVTLAAFVWLKRYSFVPSATYLAFPYLLVGLSYVFFRVLHLIIDGHQGAVEGKVGPLSYLNYTLNFTSLTSGPIQRYQDYRAMEVDCLPLTTVIAGEALERIIVGYCKVAIVSMVLLLVQRQAIADLATDPGLMQRVWSGLLVVAVYPVYLYFNFSGYVDVVIGVARFFRIVLPENFDQPFSSENVINFWGRWHMTLSGWLKTYVYNPLMLTGMTRITSVTLAPYISVVAFFVTFFLVGVWHGRTSEFIFFGLVTGFGVAANKLWQLQMQKRLGRKEYRALAAQTLYRNASRGLNFVWFAFTLVWFWSDWQQIDAMAGQLGAASVVLLALCMWVLATVILGAMEAVRAGALGVSWRGQPVIRSRYVRTAWDTSLVVITAAIIVVLDSPVPDIVYKSF